MVMLLALRLNIHNVVTYIYNVCTVSCGFYRYNKITFGFLMYYLLLLIFYILHYQLINLLANLVTN